MEQKAKKKVFHAGDYVSYNEVGIDSMRRFFKAEEEIEKLRETAIWLVVKGNEKHIPTKNKRENIEDLLVISVDGRKSINDSEKVRHSTEEEITKFKLKRIFNKK